LYSISKIALPRYSRVSYKNLNEWEFGYWRTANFTFPAVTWKNIVWSFPMPWWCNKQLPGQSASIIIAFEFFGMFVSTRIPSVFLGGTDSCACVGNNIPFFRPYFLWSNDFDNRQHFLSNSLPLTGRYFCKQISPFRLDRQSWCAGA